MDPFCYLCFVSVMLPCLFIVALWSTVGERDGLLALLYMMFSCVCVTFPCGVLGQAWYWIVSDLDLCLLPYFISCKQTILMTCHTLFFFEN